MDASISGDSHESCLGAENLGPWCGDARRESHASGTGCPQSFHLHHSRGLGGMEVDTFALGVGSEWVYSFREIGTVHDYLQEWMHPFLEIVMNRAFGPGHWDSQPLGPEIPMTRGHWGLGPGSGDRHGS